MKKIGIIGLGFMGGSLAKAIKQHCGNIYIVALNRNTDVLEEAYNDGIIDSYTQTVDDNFLNCDIVFICTPVSLISSYAEKLIPYIPKNCIITDIGSTKATIFKDMELLKDKLYFIGGHPMTGSEQTRYSASKETLYENAYYLLTPLENVPDDKIELLSNLIKNIGAIPLTIPPAKHDYVVSAISHVPHIIAAAIVNLVQKLDGDEKYMHTLAAGGFKDITRIASSSPDMWQNISRENKTEILKVLREFKNIIEEYENELSADNYDSIWNYFNSAKIYRDSFANRNPSHFMEYYEIIVDVPDKTGSIATVAALLSSNNINIKNIGIINSREFENGVLQIIFDSQKSQEKSIELLRKMNFKAYKK